VTECQATINVQGVMFQCVYAHPHSRTVHEFTTRDRVDPFIRVVWDDNTAGAVPHDGTLTLGLSA